MTSTEGLGEDNVLDGVFDRETPTNTVDTTESAAAERARDERGRFAAKTEPEPQEQAPQEQAPIEQQPAPDPNANRQVPLSELMAERKKRQEIERLHIEAEARAKAYEQMQQRQPQYQQPQPQQYAEPEQVPDPYTDPQGWAQHQEAKFQKQMMDTRASISRAAAVRQYGAEAVQQAIQSAPVNVCNHFYANSADPFGDLMEWKKEQQVRTEVGTDLEAYRKKVEEEVRQKVLAELKAGGANGQPQAKFPGSLATATGQGEQGAHLTEEAAMGSIFASSRNRKAG